MKNIDSLFMRLAVLWFVAGVALGIGMAASHQYAMMPAHAHINLLGWVSMGLFAAFYRLWPNAAASSLAKWHFWLFVPAHFVMMASLSMLVSGMTAVEPIVAISSSVVGLSVLCFAVVVWRHTGMEAPKAPAAMAEPMQAS